MSEYNHIRTQFIQLLERITEQRGFKPIHGRILACFFLSDQPRSQHFIAEWTGYSVSAVSRTLDQLMKIGSIQRYKEPGERSYRYQIRASMPSLFIGAIEQWLRMVELIRNPIHQLAQDAKRLKRAQLNSIQATEAQLLVTQLNKLDSALEKGIPLFEALIRQLEILD